MLIESGRLPDTPALAVRWATTPRQKTITGTLRTLPDQIEASGMRPPATMVVGEVVRLADKLNWYERLPLFGQRVVVTRAAGQAEMLTRRLRELGAEAIEMPAIEIRPAPDYTHLDAAIGRLESYDWLIFTSANGVRYFLERLDRSSRDVRSIRGRICAIGPATRKAIEAFHLKVDVMGREYVAESLLESLSHEPLEGKRILLARALVARDLLPNTLRDRGAQVDVCEAYRTVAPESLSDSIRRVFDTKPDWVTFTSSSTVQNFAVAAPPACLDGVKVASIGPVTTAAARNLGIHVSVEATRFDAEGLLEVILSEGIIRT
jgi:uroporphyrinogen III methyltransferase/synthase